MRLLGVVLTIFVLSYGLALRAFQTSLLEEATRVDCQTLYFDDSRDGAATIGIFNLEDMTYQRAELNTAGMTYNHSLSAAGENLAFVHVDGSANERNVYVMRIPDLQFEVIATGSFDADWLEFAWIDDTTILVKYTSMLIDDEHGVIYDRIDIDALVKTRADESYWDKLHRGQQIITSPTCI